uniref:Secreted protein n=1 Tax=Arundo donax TaxID=35708 RepID=A0A0A8YIC4_ARUDO
MVSELKIMVRILSLSLSLSLIDPHVALACFFPPSTIPSSWNRRSIGCRCSSSWQRSTSTPSPASAGVGSQSSTRTAVAAVLCGARRCRPSSPGNSTADILLSGSRSRCRRPM